MQEFWHVRGNSGKSAKPKIVFPVGRLSIYILASIFITDYVESKNEMGGSVCSFSVVVEAVNGSALCVEEHYKRGTLRGFDGVYLTPQEGFPGIIAQ